MIIWTASLEGRNRKTTRAGHALTAKSLSLLAVLLLCSCSTFTSEQTVTRPDGETVTTTIRARTFFDARSDLARLRTTQTEKTQGVALGALGQETSGTNAVELLDRVVRAAVAGAVSAAK